MSSYNKLNFGTAGIPISTTNRNTISGIENVRKLNLDAMELEFVHSVNISLANAPSVKSCALKNGVELTCHGQYYINLNAAEVDKFDASVERVINAATVANACGAKSLTFHAGFYLKDDRQKVHERIVLTMKKIVAKLKENSNPIMVSPETTGKDTQYGTVSELVNLAESVPQTGLCIDFSHLHARSVGKVNSYDEFSEILGLVEKRLGRERLNFMHIHLAGINYGDKGEKNHLILKESDMKYVELMRSLKDYKVKGVLICESPNIEGDAILLKKTYGELK